MAASRQSQLMRIKLLDAGITLFNTQGYHATGVQEVVERVGIPKGSFYNYFKSKEEFGAEVVKHWCGKTWAYIDESLDSSDGNAYSSLSQFFRNEVQRLENEEFVGCLCGNLGAELGDTKRLIQESMIASIHGIQGRFASVLRRGQREGTIRGDVGADELGRLVLDAYEGSILRMKIEGSMQPVKDFCTHIVEDYIRV